MKDGNTGTKRQKGSERKQSQGKQRGKGGNRREEANSEGNRMKKKWDGKKMMRCSASSNLMAPPGATTHTPWPPSSWTKQNNVQQTNKQTNISRYGKNGWMTSGLLLGFSLFHFLVNLMMMRMMNHCSFIPSVPLMTMCIGWAKSLYATNTEPDNITTEEKTKETTRGNH